MTTTTLAPVSRHNYFSTYILENPDTFIRAARRALKDVDFDTFVVRGMSGAIAGAMLSRSMRKNLYVIRKDDDDSHDGSQAFGTLGSRWVFLDDFISSGQTLRITFDKVREFSTQYREEWNGRRSWEAIPQHKTAMVGAYVYRPNDEGFMDIAQVNHKADNVWYDLRQNPRTFK